MGDAYLRLQDKKKFELVFVRGEVQDEDADGHAAQTGSADDDTTMQQIRSRLSSR